MFQPAAMAGAMAALRQSSLALFDALPDEDLEAPALPGWTVADVFRHLADSDRGSVLGIHLLEFLPGRDLIGGFQAKNDRNLERLRARSRDDLRRELEVWGRRMGRIVRAVPARVGALRIPTAFGKVPLAWMAGLRLYDEWVHQWDVTRAVGRPDPVMDQALADVLAPWQLLAFAADALANVDGYGVVEVRLGDECAVHDLATRAVVPSAAPTATVTTDVASWSLLAAERVPLDQLLGDGSIKVEGDEAAARALLTVVRVV